VVTNWSQQTIQPLLTVAQSYAQYLMSQPGRANDVPAAIERYRDALLQAHGSDSAQTLEALRMTINFQRSQAQWQQAAISTQELLKQQESFTGNTSEPYLSDLEIAAGVYESAGDHQRALPLRRQAVTIADLVAAPNANDWSRAWARISLARVLARLGQFDEAESVARQAVALQKGLEADLAQIRKMKGARGS
jgi:tetratricopeptide (TPR) repeat protein